MTEDTIEGIDDLYRQRLRTLMSVDDMVATLVDKLEVMNIA